ncbi:malic enzyme-like NAD(P)-binding protein [Latilactobacillus sakei]
MNKYKDQIVTFNDDIQGTGIITLVGIMGALNISGGKMTDQVYMSFGLGTAGAWYYTPYLRRNVTRRFN